MHTQVAQSRMIELRRTGHTLPEIVRMTGIGKSTVWNYIKNVQIEPEYVHVWRRKQNGSYKRAQMDWEMARQDARSQLAGLDLSQHLLILTCLYWAEGSKREFGVTNTDPAMIQTVVQCLRSLGVGIDELSVSVRIYEDMLPRKEEITAYWAHVVGVAPESITQFNVLSGKKVGKLRYGMCRVRLKKGAKYFKLVQSAIDYVKSIPMAMPS